VYRSTTKVNSKAGGAVALPVITPAKNIPPCRAPWMMLATSDTVWNVWKRGAKFERV